MLKRRAWAACTASLAAAMLIGPAGLDGASAAPAGRQPGPAAGVMTPLGTAPGDSPGGQGHRPGGQLGHAAHHRGAAPRPPQRPQPAGRPGRHPRLGPVPPLPRPRRIQARFGPPRSALAAVRAWLRSHDLTTRPALGDGLLLPATGPAGRIEAAFRTAIERVRLASGRTALLNRRAPGGTRRPAPLGVRRDRPQHRAPARVQPGTGTGSRAPGLPRGAAHPARVHGGLAGSRLPLQLRSTAGATSGSTSPWPCSSWPTTPTGTSGPTAGATGCIPPSAGSGWTGEPASRPPERARWRSRPTSRSSRPWPRGPASSFTRRPCPAATSPSWTPTVPSRSRTGPRS